jgi:hypothetical protein
MWSRVAQNHFGRSSDIASEWNTQKTPLPTVLPMLLAGRCLATTPVLLQSNGRCLAVCFAIVA